jgi:hypothetical protein
MVLICLSSAPEKEASQWRDCGKDCAPRERLQIELARFAEKFTFAVSTL